MKKHMIKIKKYLFSVILFLLLVQYNVFSNGREYGNLFYSLSVPGSDNYDYYYGEWDEPKSRVLIDKKGNKILNLLFNEDAEILKDLYTDEPKLLIKFSYSFFCLLLFKHYFFLLVIISTAFL